MELRIESNNNARQKRSYKKKTFSALNARCKKIHGFSDKTSCILNMTALLFYLRRGVCFTRLIAD